MDVTVATLLWAQWASEDYSTVRTVTSSCTLCGRCFTWKLSVKPKRGTKDGFGKTILQAPLATKHIFVHLLDEQILGRVQKKLNKNISKLHKGGRQTLVKVEQADLLRWVGNLLLSGLIGLYGKPTEGSVAASMKNYFTFFPHQQDWFRLFCTGGNKNVTTLFDEINNLQEQLGFNFKTNYEPTQVLCIEKYKINLSNSQYPSDLRVVLLLEKETGYICNFYIYSITQVLKQTRCIPFLYIIRKLLISFSKRNYIVQIDSSAHINEAITEELHKLGIRLQLVSRLGGKYGSADKENHMHKSLRDYVKLSCSKAYSVFPLYGTDYDAIMFLVVFWLLVHFSCINAFILYLMEGVDYGEDFSLKKFVKLLSQEILGNDGRSGVTQWEETTSDEDEDQGDIESEAGTTATDSSSSPQNDVTMERKGKGLTGLHNLGNTCYLNAVIQCLSCTSPLVQYFFSRQFDQHIAGKKIVKSELVNAFAKLMTHMWFGNDDLVFPDEFFSVMCDVHPPFANNHQQDSQEFLLYTLNALHEELRKKVKTRHPDKAGSNSEAEGHASESLITRLLQGVLRQTTLCLICGHTNYKNDVFTVLSLPIASAKETSVQECLECFFQQVILTRMDKIFCSFCKMKQDASVKTQLYKPPKILIIHLKRFACKGRLKKLSTNVHFPLNNLDVSTFISPDNAKHQTYTLYGVVNHFGELDFGHYTAFCKHPGTNEWNAFDDTSCLQISESMVQTSSAYLLFYTSKRFSLPKKTCFCSK